MNSAHTIDGIPLAQCTADALYREWNAGMVMDASEGLSEEQRDRLIAIERELEKHPPPDGDE
jgi:hypothetical protein